MKRQNKSIPKDPATVQTLDEHAAKNILAAYGTPVVPETRVADAAAAVVAAQQLGYPVVLKALGSKLSHKSERGLVHLNLPDADAVTRAAQIVTEAVPAAELEGLLVQPYISGMRELAVGMFRDPTFGPVVMLGIGGVQAEAIADVVFRLAPLSDADIFDMLNEIKAAELFGAFRGEAAVNRKQLVDTLQGLARLALERPEITEIDINPLRVMPDGRLLAVDALIATLANAPEGAEPSRPVAMTSIGALFYPKSIAIIGASGKLGKWGNRLFVNTAAAGYEGQIHLVNPNADQIAGRNTFSSVTEIPGPVDVAVVTIPAAAVIDLLDELAAKQIQNVLLISSGFAETGDAGRRLEAALIAKARQLGMLIFGPNTMGICNPHIQLNCTAFPVPPEPGATALVSQSGNLGVQMMAFAKQQGIGIRGFCGSGNEAMVSVEDYLQALENDTLSRTILLYIESVKDGRRFYETARRIGLKKPIVLLKGGHTAAGSHAAATHTGALRSDTRVFDAVCRQSGIVRVSQSMDLLDLAAGFDALPIPRGNRAAIMTLGGGWGVVTADLCEIHGLQVPELSQDLVARLDRLLPGYWSRTNPIDLVGERVQKLPFVILEELAKWEGCDAIIHLGILGGSIPIQKYAESLIKIDPACDRGQMAQIGATIKQVEGDYLRHCAQLMQAYDKPIVGVPLMTEGDSRTLNPVDGTTRKAVFYSTPERAVKTVARMAGYQEFLKRSGTDNCCATGTG